MSFVFPATPTPTVAVEDSSALFPVHRVYCVGRNYAEHAREMGADPNREPPFFFAKPADAIVGNHAEVPYPARTANFHHEVELVVALGSGGRSIPVQDALKHVYGYAVGNDLTRRDLQKQAKDAGKPWDVSKGFDSSAPVAAIRPVSVGGHISAGSIMLKVNGEVRQRSDIRELIWNVAEVIAELSNFFELRAGDLIFTGTPAGVGPLKRGDRIEAEIDGLQKLVHTIV